MLTINATHRVHFPLNQDITFKVVPPTAEQRLVAREIVDKIITWKSMAQAVEDAKMLIRQYPHTIYLPNIYFRTMLRDRSEGFALEFIEKFPHRPEVLTALSNYIDSWRNKLGIRRDEKFTAQQWSIIEKELQKIKAKYSNERMQRYVDKIIKDNKPQ